jgi:hypothetical protein
MVELYIHLKNQTGRIMRREQLWLKCRWPYSVDTSYSEVPVATLDVKLNGDFWGAPTAAASPSAPFTSGFLAAQAQHFSRPLW